MFGAAETRLVHEEERDSNGLADHALPLGIRQREHRSSRPRIYLARDKIRERPEHRMVSKCLAAHDEFQRNPEQEIAFFDSLICNQASPNIVASIGYELDLH